MKNTRSLSFKEVLLPDFQRQPIRIKVTKQSNKASLKTLLSRAIRSLNLKASSQSKGLSLEEPKSVGHTLNWEQKMLDSVLDQLAEAVITVDLNGHVDFANQFALQMLEVDSEQVVGKSIEELMTFFRSASFNHMLNPFEEAIQKRIIVPLPEDTVLLTRKPRSLLVQGNVYPLTHPTKGYVQGATIVLREVSPQQQGAELVQRLPGIAYRCAFRKEDAQANSPLRYLQFISEGCEQLLGFSADELTSQSIINFGELIHKSDQELVHKEIQNALRESRSYRMTYMMYTADGSSIWVWDHGKAIYDQHEKVITLEGFIAEL